MEHSAPKDPVKAAERWNKLSFKSVMDSAADMIWLKNGDGHVLEANTAFFRALGYRREELLGHPIYEHYYDPDIRQRIKAWDETVRKHGSGFLLSTMRTKQGKPLEVELRGSMLESPEGSVMLVIARSTQAEANERRRAETFYQGFKNSNDVMFYCDRGGIILDINEAFTTHYGWTREEAIGKTPAFLRSRHTTDEFYKRMWSHILDPKKGSWRGEIINKTKDGREVPVILNITAVRDDAGRITGYISNAADLSEQAALHARVAQAESLATIGEMAAVVAHEIRNPLGSIVMAAKQLASEELEPADREMVLKVLRGESQRLNEALTNFLSYARPREVKREPKDLNELVAEIVNIVKSNTDLIQKIRVKLKLSRALKPFPMDPDQVRQVVWNIVLNALQAMEGKGVLCIDTGHADRFAFLRVQDTGPGIPAAAMETLFKPFQTTKQQGTGLGLAIAERIVKAHGGRIEVASSLGHGTTFAVHLPSVED